MRGDTFLSFLDQIWILNKIILDGAKDEHFFSFIAHANEGEDIRIFDLFYIADIKIGKIRIS